MSVIETAELSSSFSGFLSDLPLQKTRFHGKLAILRLGKKSVQTATMLYGAQGRSRNPHADALVKYLAHQRDIHEVGQKTPTVLVVRMANIVAIHHGLTGQFTSSGHRPILSNTAPRTRNRQAFQTTLAMASECGTRNDHGFPGKIFAVYRLSNARGQYHYATLENGRLT